MTRQRLIDADALKEQIIKQYENKTIQDNGGVIGLIPYAPTIEADSGEVVGTAMEGWQAAQQQSAGEIAELVKKLQFWKNDSAAAWDKCEQRRLENDALKADNERLREALQRLDGWLKVRHLGGLMPDEKLILSTPPNTDALKKYVDAEIARRIGEPVAYLACFNGKHTYLIESLEEMEKGDSASPLYQLKD
jgi:hypothetical protein